MTQTLLTRQHQCPEQGQLLQQVPHAEPAVPSRRARPWLPPRLARLSGCPAAGAVGDGRCQVLRGKGHQGAAPAPLFRHSHEQGRGDGQAQLALPAPRVSAHHPEPGHPGTGSAGHGETLSLPCCSAVPVMLLGSHSRVPRVATDAQAQGWHPALTTDPGHARPLHREGSLMGAHRAEQQRWAVPAAWAGGVSDPWGGGWVGTAGTKAGGITSEYREGGNGGPNGMS